MAKIQARIILEILGRPKEHVSSSLMELINRLGAEKGVLILERKLHEPIAVKEAKDLYTSFAEITLEVEDIMIFFGILFAYMPANIEVIYPENISLDNLGFNELSNRLVQRLHDYDAIAKRLIMEKNILENKIRENAPQLSNPQYMALNSKSSPKSKSKSGKLAKSKKKSNKNS